MRTISAGLLRWRVATSVIFLLFGAALGAWTARVPAIKHDLGLSDRQLSLALLGLAAGAITGMQLAGRFVDRFGARAVLAPAALAEGVLLVPTAYVPGVVGLFLALFVFGVGHGCLNIAMNAEALRVQQAWARPVISSFHAVYSIGGFAGAAVGGLFASAGVGARVTFLCVGAGVLLVAAVAARVVALSPAPAAAHPEEAAAGPLRGVLTLGALAFCVLVGEGAAADWSAVYLRDNLHAGAGTAALGYAAFAGAMTAGRLVGDRFVARWGAVAVVRASGLLATTGLGGALLIGEPWAAAAGWACFGAGLSGIAPQIFSVAGARNPAQQGRALARVVGMGYAGFLAGPVLIGLASGPVGLPAALGIPVALAAVVALSAGVLRVGSRSGSSAAVTSGGHPSVDIGD
ncbi:MFS transporter [Actinoplanes sp. N902-109]|uniref:MFS transporter n=1 Tax=Actinoplanes sp. (strain N902-109) TaxID=649831 RepID=UPI00032934D6|nr:MFS transporter [Actinoplanes sp. N902-109]AGL18960.1 major facilitator superfamily permease [Actinoplanes sp. N902-109]